MACHFPEDILLRCIKVPTLLYFCAEDLSSVIRFFHLLCEIIKEKGAGKFSHKANEVVKDECRQFAALLRRESFG